MRTIEIVEVPAFRVIGLATRSSNRREMGGKESRIGPLWKAFLGGGVASIPDVADEHAIFSLYTGYESDQNGDYDVILGRSVTSLREIPEHLRGIEVPAAKYVLFPAGGETPADIQEAWRSVYSYFSANASQRRRFTIDFERHLPGSVHLYIAAG